MVLHENRFFFACIAILIAIVRSNEVNTNPLSAQVDYYVEGTGFHRKIHYDVEINNLTQNDCHVALYLHLPSSLFVNVDELADWERRGKVTACAEGETDVEIIGEKAGRQRVTMCALLKNNNAIFSIPVHQRYHKARFNEEFVSVILPTPKLLLGCKERIKEYLVSIIDLCKPCVDLAIKWREIPYKTETEKYQWRIPVGNLLHRPCVVYTTLGGSTLGMLFILRALWLSRKKMHDKTD